MMNEHDEFLRLSESHNRINERLIKLETLLTGLASDISELKSADHHVSEHFDKLIDGMSRQMAEQTRLIQLQSERITALETAQLHNRYWLGAVFTASAAVGSILGVLL